MLTKRKFLVAAAATLATPALPAFAHHRKAYVVPEEHKPTIVRVKKEFGPNEIHVDPNNFYLYFTMGKRKAIRYVCGVGRPGLYEAGTFTVGRKREWPSWRPTPSMIKRQPEVYGKYADGVPGGPNNPLGSRALYLHNANGYDTMLRIHGTPKPWTIGSAVSNGCARLVNAHIEHLYEQVPVGSKVVLYPQIT